MSVWAPALTATLLLFFWQGAIVAAVLWVVLVVLRHGSASARYLASAVAMVCLALLPVVTLTMLLARREAPPTPSELLVRATQLAGATAVGWGEASALTWLPRWAPLLWAIGVTVCSLRFLRGWSTVAALRDQGTPAEPALLAVVRRLEARMGLARAVPVLVSSRADGPSVIGWLRPVILMPAATVLGLSMPQLEAIIAHELAHIRRHDYLVNLFQVVVETVLFYHPVTWWVSARMRFERELCCDDDVVRLCGDRLVYARALTALERIRLVASSDFALASTDGPLSYRVQRLLGLSPSPQRPMKTPTLFAVCLVLACSAPVVDSPHATTSISKGAPAKFSLVLDSTSQPSHEAKAKLDVRLDSITQQSPRFTIRHEVRDSSGSPAKGTTPKRISADQPMFDFQVEQMAKPAPGNAAPEYPAALRAANIEGKVTVRFVVDTTGHADVSSLQVVSTTDDRFTEAVRTHLPTMRFIAAEVGSRKVKQLIEMPFEFKR